MSPPRIFVTSLAALTGRGEVFLSPQSEGANPLELLFTLDAVETNHLRNALRIRTGESVEVVETASSRLFLCEVTQLIPLVNLRIVKEIPTSVALDGQTENSPEISLLCALNKGSKNDLICDWATELGCSHLSFWQSEHSIVRLKSAEDCRSKQARWEKVVLAAAKQSKQIRPPTVQVSLELHSALATLPAPMLGGATLGLCCSLSPGAKTFRELKNVVPAPSIVHLVIGPEGDLTATEEETLAKHGFRMVSLGSRILRAELAAVTAILQTQSTFSV